MNGICTICGHAGLDSRVAPETYMHADKPLLVDGIEYSHCSNCGEDTVSAEQFRRNQLRVTNAKRVTNGLRPKTRDAMH